MPIANGKTVKHQIGVSKQQDNLYFVWLDEKHKVQSLCLKAAQRDIFAQFLTHFPGKQGKLEFIGAISPHLTWTKTLILPQSLNAQECERQCEFILQKELPIPLDELWFDYVSTPLKQGFRLDIYAVRQTTAEAEVAHYLPIKLTALDLLTHSLLRAFYAILNKELENTLFLYQDMDLSIAICECSQQRQVLQSQGDLSKLYLQFITRYPDSVEQVYVYQSPELTLSPKGLLPLSKEWQRIETDFPFIALGNALWRQDLKLINLSPKATALFDHSKAILGGENAQS